MDYKECTSYKADRVKKILRYIHENYNKKLTADDIANHANISRGECFRCFKQLMNMTPVEYITEYRLQRAAELLRETEKNMPHISAECGFENASYFGKIFKSVYSMTPLQYRRAHIWTDNTVKNINGYDYEYFIKTGGSGTMIIPYNADNGSFSCEWSQTYNIVFRSGKKFGNFEKTHGQTGAVTLRYDADYTSDGCAFLNVYGWTVDPLAEFYITECYTAYKPPVGAPCIGTLNTDGGTYEIFHMKMGKAPSIIGLKSFDQYWSIRTAGRRAGTVDVSAHFNAWEGLGLKMGKLAEVALSVEGLRSSGSAVVRTNVLTIGANLHTPA